MYQTFIRLKGQRLAPEGLLTQRGGELDERDLGGWGDRPGSGEGLPEEMILHWATQKNSQWQREIGSQSKQEEMPVGSTPDERVREREMHGLREDHVSRWRRGPGRRQTGHQAWTSWTGLHSRPPMPEPEQAVPWGGLRLRVESALERKQIQVA